jgi:hypothetical protein
MLHWLSHVSLISLDCQESAGRSLRNKAVLDAHAAAGMTVAQ